MDLAVALGMTSADLLVFILVEHPGDTLCVMSVDVYQPQLGDSGRRDTALGRSVRMAWSENRVVRAQMLSQLLSRLCLAIGSSWRGSSRWIDQPTWALHTGLIARAEVQALHQSEDIESVRYAPPFDPARVAFDFNCMDHSISR